MSDNKNDGTKRSGAGGDEPRRTGSSGTRKGSFRPSDDCATNAERFSKGSKKEKEGTGDTGPKNRGDKAG